MKERVLIPHAIAALAIAAALLCFGAIQAASESLTAQAASAWSLPRLIPPAFGLRVYEALDRVAPAPYVEATLANAAFDGHNLSAAQVYAVRLPASPARDEVLARIAAARGESELAYEYFFAAADVQAVEARIARVATSDPASAYVLERRFRERLNDLTTHPDAVAEAYWLGGTYAAIESGRAGESGAEWPARALASYRVALELAPLNMKYDLAAGNQAVSMHRWADAESFYRHGLDIDPASPDAIAGLGIVALGRGDRPGAVQYARRARAIDPNAALLRALVRELR